VFVGGCLTGLGVCGVAGLWGLWVFGGVYCLIRGAWGCVYCCD
jgi:hypothetical protein